MNWNRNSKSYNVNEAFMLGESTLDSKGKKEVIRERSDSQSSVEDDDGPVANPKGLPTKAESIDFGLDEEVDKRKPYRDCLTGCFVVFFVLAMMACVAILLYFILINTVFAATETNSLTGALNVEGSVLLNETYQSELEDPESMAYKEMEKEFLSSLNASFSGGSLADVYDGAKVERFEQGSIRIIFTIFLLSAPNNADTEVDVIFEVQVTIGNGINSGFFDVFEVIENSLDITTVNQESRTTNDSPKTTPTEVPGELTTVTTIYSSATSQLMLSLSTLLSTPVTTVTLTTQPTTTRLLSTHSPASPTAITLTTPTTTSIPSTTSSTLSKTTTQTTSATITTIDSTGTFHFTSKPTTIPLSSTDISTSGTTRTTTTPSTAVSMSTTSSTTMDNATGPFNFTIIPTTIPPSSTNSTTDTTLTTTPSITRIISSTSSPTAATTTPSSSSSSTTTNTTTTTTATTTTTTMKTTPTESLAVTHDSFTDLTTTRSSSTATTARTLSTTAPPTTTTSSSSSSSSTLSSSSPSSPTPVNITRQPKIHPALPDVCGIRPALNDSGSTARIVGGTQSAQASWPWIGSLRQGASHQCGAVLIHQEWAITAHHCIGFFDNIVLGDNDLQGNSDTSPYRVQRNVQTFPNPDFDHVTDNGDIALVRLIEPVEFNDYVQPLCINTVITEMTSFNNCFVAGWGTDDILNQVAMRYLQEAHIQMFDRGVCSQWYQGFHTITDQHLCAGEEDGRRDACSGDSGGPLQCQDDQGIWYLLGVVSFGQDCGQPMLPGVYTRVSTQITFLSEILDTNIK